MRIQDMRRRYLESARICGLCGQQHATQVVLISDIEVCVHCANEFDVCPVCQKLHKDKTSNNPNVMNQICDDCFESGWDVCFECGEPIHIEDQTLKYVQNTGEIICEDCLTSDCSDYVVCDCCGGVFNKEEMDEDNSGYTEEGTFYCESCASDHTFVCSCCENLHDMSECEYHSDMICTSCADDYCYCTECDELYHIENGEFDSEGEFYCYDCFNERLVSEYVKYTSKNEMELSDTRFFGVELEVDDGGYDHSIMRHVHESMPVNCVADGSLYNGFEMNFHPMTLKYIEENRNRFEDLFYYLRNHGYKADDTITAGLHVHINRESLGRTPEEQDLATAKIMKIIARMDIEDILKFTRRDPQLLRKWSNIIPVSEEDTPQSTYNRDHSEKYTAINRKHHQTIEFRLFKATLDFDTYLATIKFVQQVCELATDPSIEFANLSSVDFIEDADAQYNEYLKRVGIL